MELKIFRLSHRMEVCVVAAFGLVHALQVYCDNTDYSLCDFSDDDQVIELPKEDWGKIKFKVDEETEEVLSVDEILQIDNCPQIVGYLP